MTGMRLLPLLALCVAGASVPASADYPVAPDVVVFCEPTLRRIVTVLGTEWSKETGIPARIFAAPTWANLAQLAHHTRDDIIIAEGDATPTRGLIKGDTVLKLWQNKLVAAALAAELENARSGSSPLNLASVAGKAPVAIVDPDVAQAGKQTEAALQALGLWNAIRAKSMGVVDTADAAFLLAQGDVKLAVLYASDVSAYPNFAVTDTLPDAPPIIYWAAQTEHALSPNVTKFLDFLRRPDVREQGKDAGLEVLK
jgi:ABC-type molybdate transport system substrate-binding protein